MKAQAAMEYLIVAALILAIIIPTTYIFFSYSQRSTAQIREGQIQKMGKDIVNTAETIFFLGEPSRILLEETMPEGVRDIKISNDWQLGVNELVFTTSFTPGDSEFVFSSKVNILAGGDEPGRFDDTDRNPGTKKIRLSAHNGPPPYVLVNIT